MVLDEVQKWVSLQRSLKLKVQVHKKSVIKGRIVRVQYDYLLLRFN